MTTWRREIEEYEADLFSVQEPTFLNRLLGLFTQRKGGEMEMKRYDDGGKDLEIKIFNVSVPEGALVSVVVNGSAICEVRLNQGRGRLLLSTTQGETVPDIGNGSTAAVHYLGNVLLQGSFKPD